MLDFLYHLFNYTIAVCYFVIFLIIFAGLLKERVFGRNMLGTATGGIFFTCALGHFSHAITNHAAGSIWEVGLLVIVDGWTIIPAIAYLVLRRRFGLLIKGPDIIEEYRTQLAQKSTQLKEMRESEERKDNFFAIASHELRTPMTTVKAYSQLLETKLGETEDHKTKVAVQAITQQVDRMHNLITTLLELSRIQTGKLELKPAVIDFSKCVIDTTTALQEAISSHQFHLTIPSSSILVKADQLRLEQVIINLLTNAVKYSPNSDVVQIALQVEKNNALLKITDFGVGIDSSELTKIFERFYRSPSLKSSGKDGLGLGLYISNEIIKNTDGYLSVESEPGKGSTFIVSLPLATIASENQLLPSGSESAARSAEVSTSS